MWLYWLAGALGVCCLLLLVYLLRMKRQLYKIAEELRKNMDTDYNHRLSVTLFDRSVETVAAEINRSLDYQQRLKYTAQCAENNLRQSLSDIAHDLRTPLTVVKGNLQLIAGSGELTGENQDYLAVCTEKADALRQMADAFFELSVLESDSRPVPLQKVDLTKLLMQFIADHEPVIRMQNQEPEVVLPPHTVTVMADPQMLGRMLENLLNNALRYAQGSFQIRLEQDGVVFANTVAPENRPDPARLFDRSYRAEPSRTSKNAGLGLYIVRLLAEKQQAAAEASMDGDLLTLRLRFRTEAPQPECA
ncbi:MAG: HAMP domain-containing histidine kinase [Oscillospiraceae bacterium]|nr:HAMP domain-containing histidine kinase [Oscillospiraceae bacterium]